MSRTNPSEALERLAMTLNYPRGEPLSINELAEKTDLSWATTKKYVQLLETLGRIAPKISVDEDGVIPKALGENFHDIKDERDIQFVVYLFIHANINGNPTSPLDLDKHEEIIEQYEDTVEELEELGWIELSDDSIKLTPQGISIAGPAQSRIKNQDIELRPNQGSTQSTSRPNSSGEANILVDDPTEEGLVASNTKSKKDDNWDNDYNKNDFQQGKKVLAK